MLSEGRVTGIWVLFGYHVTITRVQFIILYQGRCVSGDELFTTRLISCAISSSVVCQLFVDLLAHDVVVISHVYSLYIVRGNVTNTTLHEIVYISFIFTPISLHLHFT